MAAKTELAIVVTAKDEASKVIKGLGIDLKSLGIGMAATGAVITGALGVAVNAAQGAQVEMAKVSALLEAMGDKGKGAEAEIIKAADATLKLGFDNESAALSITKLFQRTGDLEQATKLNALAMDLARAKNMDLASAGDLVGMVLSGNGRVLKQYGIDLKDSATPLEALGELQKKVGGQAEAFGKTFAGGSEILQQQVSELQEKIGAQLLPILGKMLEHVTPLITKLMEWIDQNPKLTETIITIAAVLGPLLVVLPALVMAIAAIGLLVAAGVLLYQNWDIIKAKAFEVWEAIHAFLVGIYAKMGIDLDGFIAGLVTALKACWEIVKLEFGLFVDIFTGNWSGAWEKIQQIVGIAGPMVKQALAAVWDQIVKSASASFDNLKKLVQDAVNFVIDKANNMIASINRAASSAASSVGLSAPQIPSIPRLATGGIVTKPTIALVGEAGPEAVIPLSKMGSMGGGGTTVNVMQGAVISLTNEADEKRLTQTIVSEITRALQGQRNGLSTSI